jgi:hypothetical protein
MALIVTQQYESDALDGCIDRGLIANETVNDFASETECTLF